MCVVFTWIRHVIHITQELQAARISATWIHHLLKKNMSFMVLCGIGWSMIWKLILGSWTFLGAVVGGPDHDDKFYDQRSDWTQTEIALDYNAPFQGLVAHQLSLDNVNDPPYASITDPRPFVTRPKAPLAQWIVAVIVIVIVFVVAGALYICWWKRHAIMQRCCGATRRNTSTNYPLEPHQKDFS